MCVCVCVRARACARACVRSCVCVLKTERNNVSGGWGVGGKRASRGVLGEAKVSCILRHRGVQLSLQQLRVEGDVFYFFCFFTVTHFTLSPLSLSFISSTISSVSLLLLSGRRHNDVTINLSDIREIIQFTRTDVREINQLFSKFSVR